MYHYDFSDLFFIYREARKLVFTDRASHFIHEDQPKLVIKEITSLLKRLPSDKGAMTTPDAFYP